jgi:Viral BACON domain
MLKLRARRLSTECLLLAGSLLVLASCSGGGGGGDQGSGLSLSTTSLSFSAVQGGSAPPRQSILVTITDPSAALIAAGVPVGSTVPSWLGMSLSGSGTSQSVDLAILSTVLSPGTYTVTVRVGIARRDQSVIGFRDAQVTYTIRAGIEVSTSSLGFLNVIGSSATPVAQSVRVIGTPGIQWTVSADQSWITLDATSGTVPGSVSVGVRFADLAFGAYHGILTFAGGGQAVPVSVDLNVGGPLLGTSSTGLTFGGTDGRDLSPATVALSLTTGTNSYAWTVSGGPSWLHVSPASGVVSGTPVSITLAPDAAGLTGGTHTGSVTFTSQVLGNTATASLPVTINLDEHKVLPSDYGVAFASTPSLSKLSRTLRVRSNRNVVTSWSASSNQTWLKVTPSGTTSDGLVLTADPAGLAADTVHSASVSLTSDDLSIPGTETIRVGLWVGAATPDPASPTTVSAQYQEVVADPIRPYAYLHDGGTDVTVYNVYTGAVVRTLSSVGAKLDGMAIASDGARLFVIDFGNWTIVPIDLDSFVAGTPWPMISFVFFGSNLHLAYARTNGYGVVIGGDGQLYDASSGSRLNDGFVLPLGRIMAASRNGARFCGLEGPISPCRLTCRSADRTGLGGGQMILGTAKDAVLDVIPGNGQEVALNADGSRAYVAAGAPYAFTVYDAASSDPELPTLGTLGASAYPSAIKLGTDDRIYGAASVTAGDPVDVWVYDQGGTLGRSFDLGGGVRRLAISGEALRMTVVGPSLEFVTIPPP